MGRQYAATNRENPCLRVTAPTSALARIADHRVGGNRSCVEMSLTVGYCDRQPARRKGVPPIGRMHRGTGTKIGSASYGRMWVSAHQVGIRR
jgi:hypothetical protein